MRGRRQINQLLEELRVLGGVALAFSRISSTRMKNIRSEVLTSRDFQFSVYEIFREVFSAYVRQMRMAGRREKIEKVTFLSHNGRTVALFLSANASLYGDIVNRTFDLFAKDIRGSDMEVAIVGRLGLSLYRNAFPRKPYTYFDLADYGKDNEHLVEIIRHVVQYERVQIYCGKYENLVTQSPFMYDISTEVPLGNETSGQVSRYLFEPTIEELLAFFESELFTSLLDHVVFESQLAKLASRMIAMDFASRKIGKQIDKTVLKSMKAGHESYNRKQQNSMSSTFFLSTYGR